MGATRPHNPAARGEPLGATAPWQNRSQPKKNKPTLNTKLRILPLRAGAPRRLIFGEGELTHELLARELIDPERFRNSRQVANYFGLCPRESTSDQRRRLGAITKHGHPRLRRLMVELAWRVSRSSQTTVECAAGERCSRIGKPRGRPARKPLWPWRVNWPSTSGEWPPDEWRLKNLAWCKKSGSTETLFKEDPFPEQRNVLAHRRKPFGTAHPRHRR